MITIQVEHITIGSSGLSLSLAPLSRDVMCNKKMTDVEIKPTDKRPIEFTIIILSLVLDVPFFIVDIALEQVEYLYGRLILNIIFLLLAAGLWLRKEVARKILLNLVGLLSIPTIIMLAMATSMESAYEESSNDVIYFVASLITIAVIFFYLRSDRLLKYYWADEIRKNT